MMNIYLVTLGFILMDVITGLLKAVATNSFKSSIMRQGLFHKTAEILTLVFFKMVDVGEGYVDIGINVPTQLFACGYIVLMEMGQIAENIAVLNPDLDIKKILDKFKK